MQSLTSSRVYSDKKGQLFIIGLVLLVIIALIGGYYLNQLSQKVGFDNMLVWAGVIIGLIILIRFWSFFAAIIKFLGALIGL